MKVLSDIIKRELTKKDKTQYWLAKEANIDAGNLSRIMTNKSGATFETVAKICKALDLSLDDVAKKVL